MKKRVGTYGKVLFDIRSRLCPEFPILYRDSLYVVQGTPLVLANVVFVNASIDRHRFPQVYWQICPRSRNQKPLAILLDESFRGTLFGDDVGVSEPLVSGDTVGEQMRYRCTGGRRNHAG